MKCFSFAVFLSLLAPFSEADERRSAAELFPPSTVLYAELTDPPQLLATVFDHPLREKIEALEPYKLATQTQKYRNFLTGKKFLEIQYGMEWREALESLTAKGIYVGLDAETQGVAALLRGKAAESMELLRSKLLELLKMGQGPDAVQQQEYRGIATYEASNIKFAFVEDWLLVTNKVDLGKSILDRLLGSTGNCLGDDKNFQAAQAARRDSLTLWAYGNVGAVRDGGAYSKFYTGTVENPTVELLVGGIMSTLQQTPFVTAELMTSQSGLGLAVKMPYQHAWIPEEREYFFGANGTGRGPALPATRDTLFTLSAYRDVSEMWLRAGDLFSEKITDGFAVADATLTTLLSGKVFGEDILGLLTPEIGFVATKQDFTDVLPKPAIRLPSFAFVLELKDPESMVRELRRTFQNLLGFFNVVGAAEGSPQLEMNMERLDNGGELITSMYVPEPDDVSSQQAGLIFNFSPSVGFAGERFVVSSTATLARALISAPKSHADHVDSNTAMRLEADVLKDVLADNREHLVARNILGGGAGREEAEATIALLLDVVGYFKAASLKLDTTNSELKVEFDVRLTGGGN